MPDLAVILLAVGCVALFMPDLTRFLLGLWADLRRLFR
jgi:hypothetical protein